MKTPFTLFIALFFINTFGQDLNQTNTINIEPESNVYQFSTVIDLEASSVKNQGNTGTCWSFSTSSFLESEIYRISGKSIDISEMYNVHTTYTKKAWNYVMRQGLTQFSEGGLGHDVMNAVKVGGLVPNIAYTGLLNGAVGYDHSKIIPELKVILDDYIKNGKNATHVNWQADVENILDKYLGKNLEVFDYEGKVYTPESFLKMTGFNPADYVTITSFEHVPYYQSFILNIPDNFSNGSFYNVTLEELNSIALDALSKGYSIDWDGDVSEKTFSAKPGIAFIPKDEANAQKGLTAIIPELDITPDFRQQEFNNFDTTDDHLMHIIGLVQDQNGNKYYKVKNSWGTNSSRIGNDGYIFMSESFFKLKSISIMVHKDALSVEMKEKLAI